MKILKEFGRDAYVDWATILIVCVLLAGSLAFIGVTLYNAVIGAKLTSKSVRAPLYTKPNEAIITQVKDLFETRAETSKKAETGYAGAADPSIQ